MFAVGTLCPLSALVAGWIYKRHVRLPPSVDVVPEPTRQFSFSKIRKLGLDFWIMIGIIFLYFADLFTFLSDGPKFLKVGNYARKISHTSARSKTRDGAIARDTMLHQDHKVRSASRSLRNRCCLGTSETSLICRLVSGTCLRPRADFCTDIIPQRKRVKLENIKYKHSKFFRLTYQEKDCAKKALPGCYSVESLHLWVSLNENFPPCLLAGRENFFAWKISFSSLSLSTESIQLPTTSSQPGYFYNAVFILHLQHDRTLEVRPHQLHANLCRLRAKNHLCAADNSGGKNGAEEP